MGSADMQFNVFLQSYHELRRAVERWTFILLGAAAALLLIRPLLMLAVDLDRLGAQGLAGTLLGALPDHVQLGRTWDWLQATGFGLLFPLLLAIYAVGKGSWLVAGEEERGSLGMLLAAPLARWRLVLEKAAALVVVVFQPAFALWILLILLRWIGVTPGYTAGLERSVLGLFLLALIFGALGLALGCLTGRRKQSRMAAGMVLALAFIFSRLPEHPPLLNAIRSTSPVTWYAAVLPGAPGENGVYLLALLALALVCFGLAWVAFERRDLAV
jgi:ABC-2 type transport system permease protein